MARLNINRGTSFNITYNYHKDGVPADLTGATVRFTMKSTEYDADATDTTALVLKNVTSHTDPTGGITEIVITPADTATVVPGTYYYDIKVSELSGEVFKTDEGTIKLDGSPTNRLS